jgi:hypothetical protein
MGRKRYPKQLPLAEHLSLGPELKAIRNRLLELSVRISNAYGTSDKRGRYAHQAYIAVDNLRCLLDDDLLRDHPDQVRVYYGRDGGT